MIRIDDSLLEEIGLLALPKDERDKLLRQIYETLEMRVGMRLAERMSDSQLDEFERFINGDLVFTEDYLNQKKPNWQQGEQYQKALQNAQAAAQRSGRQANENAVKTEFGALTWLETNFPDYKQVVAEELEKLKVEIKADSSKIMEAYGSVPQVAPTATPHQDQQTQGAYQAPVAPAPQPPQAAQPMDQSVQPAPAPMQPMPPTPPSPLQPPSSDDQINQPPQFPPAQAA